MYIIEGRDFHPNPMGRGPAVPSSWYVKPVTSTGKEIDGGYEFFCSNAHEAIDLCRQLNGGPAPSPLIGAETTGDFLQVAKWAQEGLGEIASAIEGLATALGDNGRMGDLVDVLRGQPPGTIGEISHALREIAAAIEQSRGKSG